MTPETYLLAVRSVAGLCVFLVFVVWLCLPPDRTR